MKSEKAKEIPEKKIHVVGELSNLMKNKKTILVASIKNIPASQFQEISKKLRSKAIIRVPKKNLVLRAIDNFGDDQIKKIKAHIKENTAILFSNLDSFELALELVKNRRPARAKVGQEAPEDIIVPEGPTDLIPGPAISELGALGIQIQIEKGKITIKEPKVIVKKGEKISKNAANIMSKLDIKPFLIGFTPILSFDTKEKKLYLDIKIDIEGTAKELKESFRKSLSFAVEIGYISNDTIKFLIAKASVHEKVLENLLREETFQEKTGENVQENKSESTSEES